MDLATGELARLFHGSLGNTSSFNSIGLPTACHPTVSAAPNGCLTNAGPFSNVIGFRYWYGTEYSAPNSGLAWEFNFYDGQQDRLGTGRDEIRAWAVRTGDLALVTVPPAALVSRAGGLAYYDPDTNLTWVADANLASTSGFDSDGFMTWAQANSWIASLNAQSGGQGYLGTNNWRLPTVTDLGPVGCVGFPAYNGTDCGFNVDLSSEMARLDYITLGNNAYYDTSGVETGCLNVAPGCLTNTGPFSNLIAANYYWSGTDYGPGTSKAWIFSFGTGAQNAVDKSAYLFAAWAVRSGDLDSDNDGFTDGVDNCTLVAIPSQLDSDGDGYGNICDGDINNSGTVTTADFGLLRSVLGQPASFSPAAAAADMNGSGTVTTADFGLLRARLGTTPGPSGLACAGTVPCP